MTRINVRWHSSHRWLHITLMFSRDIHHIDTKRCKRAFAEALHEAFTQQGVGLETINFNDGRQGPIDDHLYRMSGYAELLHGSIASSQLATFGNAFLRRLNEVREYTASYQRQLRRPE